jgi:hypothetical protein
MGPESEGIPISVTGDKVVRSPRIDAATIQTTIAIPNGKKIVLSSIGKQSTGGKELIVIITPHILGLEDLKKTR